MLRNILILILLRYGSSYSQTQIGTDIDGEGFDGYTVSISANGNVIAFGTPFNDGNGENSGHVRIYENLAGSWVQIGSDIDGEAARDLNGRSISLSANGNIVAIGANANDGNGIDSGHVRVYQNVAGSWIQIGLDIDGVLAGEASGYSVSLSADGSIVAIGAPWNNVNGSQSGQVRVYQNVANTWTQMGTNINGQSAGYSTGYSVSLSENGNILAIGCPSADGNGTDSGTVRIYQIIAGSWIQIGSDINGEAGGLGAILGDQSGWSVSLSADGNIVAIGSPFNDGNGIDSGHVRVYQNVAGSWIQIGSDIDGEAAGDRSGCGISLSAGGNIIAIGALKNDGNGIDSGHGRVYENLAGIWTQVGTDINGESAGDECGRALAISADGAILAIGAQFNDGSGLNSGHVRVYDLSAVLASNSYVGSNFNIYPNPSKGVVNISLDNNLQIEKVNFYNQIGQLVKTVKSNIISTLELEKGCYFIQVVTSQGNATKQLIVE